MSKLFFDHLIVWEEIDQEIKKVPLNRDEKDELWKLLDEISSHRVLTSILDKLPLEHHEEFLDKFEKAPYDEKIFTYLKEKIGANIEELIKQEIGDLAYELLQDIKRKEN
jgi:hypothetical protein